MASHCHYSISKSPSPKTVEAPSSFTKKQPRNHYSYTTNQPYPRNQRSMSGNVSKIDAQTQTTSIKHQNMFDDILCINEYPEDSIDQTKHPQSHQRNSPPPNVDWSYLKIPYISERLNHKITNIFRKEGIPVRVAHRSYTLRRALSCNGTQAESICTRDNCPTSKTKLCL